MNDFLIAAAKWLTSLRDGTATAPVTLTGTPSAALSEYVDDGTGFVLGTSRATAVGGPVDDTATATASEGDFVVGRYTARRAALTTLDTLIAGEDQTNNVMRVEGQFSGTYCTADTQVKASAGFVHAISIFSTDAVPTAGTIIVYDNTAESGTIVASFDVKATANVGTQGSHTIILDRIMTIGIYVGFTTVADVTVSVTWR